MIEQSNDAGTLPFAVGDAILIRTVTMMLLGRVKAIASDYVVLDDAGWIAESSRFGEMLAMGAINEYERAPSWCLVAWGSFVDVWPWPHPIPQASI
jgi:hypothetical protein